MRARVRKPVVNVAFRLPAEKHRALRVVLARKGTSMQVALERAVDQLISDTDAEVVSGRPADLCGLLRDTEVMEIMERERQEELARDHSWR